MDRRLVSEFGRTARAATDSDEAYFDGALDAIFSVISKSSFEDRLRAHFDTDPNSQADASWYALRNIVYASGCRISLSDEAGPAAFAQSRLQSWGYYENALSVHTELIYASADLDAIRALLLMVEALLLSPVLSRLVAFLTI